MASTRRNQCADEARGRQRRQRRYWHHEPRVSADGTHIHGGILHLVGVARLPTAAAGRAGKHPVRRPVDRSGKVGHVDKGLDERYRMAVRLFPVGAQKPEIQAENPAPEPFDLHPRQDEETLVTGHEV